MKPAENRKSLYGNGETLREAREVTGLNEEFALLRLHLKHFAESKTPDEGMILAAVNRLARTLMAQARVKGADPEETSMRLAAALHELGSILIEDPP